MFFHLRNRYPQLNAFWDKYRVLQKRRELPPKTVLLEEGERSQYYFFIEKGCVRAFFNDNGVHKTIQFFFENEGLSSLDSFVNNVPSQFSIETVEPCIIGLLHKRHVRQWLDELAAEPGALQMVLQITARRQAHYINEFVSLIRDTPEQRYLRLLSEQPHIIQRIPQHYIASYLGISAVHLSRIKSKLAKGKTRF